MKKIILSLIFVASVIASFGQAGSSALSGIFLRVNDTTTYQSASATRHSQGYSDIYFNNQAVVPHFDIWNGSNYDHVFSFGGSGSCAGCIELTNTTYSQAGSGIVGTTMTPNSNAASNLGFAGNAPNTTFIRVWNDLTEFGSVDGGNFNLRNINDSTGAEFSDPRTIETGIQYRNFTDYDDLGDNSLVPKIKVAEMIAASGSGTVQSVTGDGVDNTDPVNPVIDLTSSRTVSSADDLDQSDNLHIVYADCGSPCDITVDLLTVESQVTVINIGAATATLIEGAGVTLPGTTVAIAPDENAIIIYRVAATPDVYTGSSSGGTVTSVSSANADITVATGTTTPVLTMVQTPALRSATTTVDVSAATAPTTGQVLTATSGTAATWQTPSSGFADPMTTRGDIIVRDASNVTARLGIGTNGQIIRSDGTDLSWATPPYYLLASGGTATAANTFTSNTISGFTWDGAFTTTANDQLARLWSGTYTMRGTTLDFFYANRFASTLIAGANNQIKIGTHINHSFNDGAFTGQNNIQLLVGPVASGMAFGTSTIYAAGSTLTIGASNSARFVIGGISGNTEVGSTASETTASFTVTTNAQGNSGGKGLVYLKSVIGASGATSGSFYGINSDGAISSPWTTNFNYFGSSFRNTFAPSASSSIYTGYDLAGTINASGGTTTWTGVDIHPTETSLTGVTMYGVRVRSTTALNGFGVTPTATLHALGTVKLDATVTLPTAGNGIAIKEGTNATMGVATLASGTVTVSTTKVTANSRIFISINGGSLTNLGIIYEDKANRTAGTSFIIKSSNILDAADVVWVILEPAP